MIKLENFKKETIPVSKLVTNNDIVEKCKTEKILLVVKKGIGGFK